MGGPGAALALAGLAGFAVALVATPLGTGASSSQQTLKAASAKPVPRGCEGSEGRAASVAPRKGAPRGVNPTGPRGLEDRFGADGDRGPGADGSDRPAGIARRAGPPGVGFGRRLCILGSRLDGRKARRPGDRRRRPALITYDGGRSLNVARCTDWRARRRRGHARHPSDRLPAVLVDRDRADGLGLISYSSSVEHLRVAHSRTRPVRSNAVDPRRPNDFAFRRPRVTIGSTGSG